MEDLLRPLGHAIKGDLNTQSSTMTGEPLLIPPLPRDHSSNSSARIVNIPGPARDHMYMQVRHGLASGATIVDAYVHRVQTHLGLHEFNRLVERSAKTLTLEERELGEGLDVTPWDHEQVTFGDRITIPAEEERPRFADNIPTGCEVVTERAGCYFLCAHLIIPSIAAATRSNILKSPGTSP